MAIKNEKEFLSKHGFKFREAYNKKQRAIFEKKINPFILYFLAAGDKFFKKTFLMYAINSNKSLHVTN